MDRKGEHVQAKSDGVPRYLGILLGLLFLAGLKWSAIVSFPLLLALFFLFFLWPLQLRFQHYLPNWLAVCASLFVVLIIVALVVSALLYSGYLITQTLPNYSNNLGFLYDSLTEWAHKFGMPEWQEIEDMEAFTTGVANSLARVFTGFLTAGGFLGLTLTMLILGLVEIPRFQKNLNKKALRQKASKVYEVIAEISDKLHGFMMVRTFTSAITGLLTGLICWLIGLDLAFVWGLIAFILNYIPTLGSAIAVIPPTLMAGLQFGTLLSVLGVLSILTLVQMTVGNYVDPRLQGRWISISPLLAFFSLMFWGWVGSVPGAILGVPLTIGLLITAYEFPQTQWIALLLADIENDGHRSNARENQQA